jgi:hypothetical protein
MKFRPIYLIAAVMLGLGTTAFLLADATVSRSSLFAPSVQWTDNFSSSTLDSRWAWIREDATHWSLTDRPGFLRITTQEGSGPDGGKKNILLQLAPPGDFEIRTRVIFNPTESFHSAGLLVNDDDDHYIHLERGFCLPCIGIDSGIYFVSESGGSYEWPPTISAAVSITDTYLRIVKAGAVYTASYSIDGNSWTVLGSHTNSSLTPKMIGISVGQGDVVGISEIPADFDFFTVITPTFPDVPSGHWAWQFVETIFSEGLTSGYPDGTYRPDNPVTRGEMAVFIKKGIHGSTYTPPAPDGSHPFDDIAGHWAEAWIEDLYDEGFTSGFPDGTYRPENQVTRAEIAVFLKKAIHGSAYTSPTPDGSHPFSDIAGHWAEAWIEDLYDEGITTGFPDGTYRPENHVTRAEMAVFLVNAFSLPLP